MFFKARCQRGAIFVPEKKISYFYFDLKKHPRIPPLNGASVSRKDVTLTKGQPKNNFILKLK